MDRKQAAKQRKENPVKRDEYLRRCSEQAKSIYDAVAQANFSLRDERQREDYLSILETAEFLEQEGIGKEGVDF